MIHSAADILQILAADPVVASSVQLATVDKEPPPLKGEGAWLYVTSYPKVVDDFAEWNLWLIDFEGDMMTDMVVKGIKKLLPSVEGPEKEAGFLKFKTSYLVSKETVVRPAPKPVEAVSGALPSAFKSQLEEALEKLQDQALVKPKAGKAGKQGEQGPPGPMGPQGPAGRDAAAQDIDLDNLKDVNIDGTLKKGQILMWDGTQWVNRFAPQSSSSIGGGGGGGGGGLEHWTETAEGHLLPNNPGAQSIGSALNPILELYATGNTIHLDDKPLGLDGSARLIFDGQLVSFEDGIAEAPIDGDSYVRRNGAWERITGGAGGGGGCGSTDGGAACTTEWDECGDDFPEAP
ncbi:predicted protein [Cyanophage PSS2]|uniref:hypothetical protein n=1 Tax=Cyanophage PSS2 TaxID=658401 RepID=UPI0001B0401B|nr:hypothetical protein PSS2_gp069 [Cyanophage PSS2]ACT65631.1 hypothetical protein [Cyanophage PSS2]ACY75773.1 predicted protein [Cyanophage PSS2]